MPAPPAPELPRWRRLQTRSLLVALLGLLAGVLFAQGWIQREVASERAMLQRQLEARAGTAVDRVTQRLHAVEQMGTALALSDDTLLAAERLGAVREADPEVWAQLNREQRHGRLVQGAEAARFNRSLQRLEQPLSLSLIYLIDAEGWCVAASQWERADRCIGARYADRAYFQQAMATGHARQFAMGRQVRQASLFLATRVGPPEAPEGVLVVRAVPESLLPMLPRVEVQGMVLDRAGMVIAAHDASLLLRHAPFAPPPDTSALRDTYGLAALEALPLQQTGDGWRFQGRPSLVAHAPLADGSFGVLLMASEKPLNTLSRRLWGTAIALLALGLLAVLLTERLLDHAARRRAHLQALQKTHGQLQALAEQLHEQANTDPLTGVANRRHFLHRLNEEIDRAQRSGQPLSVIAFDIDHFKRINDSRGHGVGDEAIRALAQRCKDLARPYDLVARLGGEEFAVLLAGASAEAAHTVAERIRQVCASRALPLPDGPLAFTVSAGVAVWRPGEDPASWVARADAALYDAKRGGRDRVVIAD